MSKQLSDLDFNSQARITGLLTPVGSSEPATKAFVESLTTSWNWKTSARVRVTTNINTASPGASLDAVAMAANDRVFLDGQTTGNEKGLWVWNGSAVAMTRPTDFDDVAANSPEILGAIIPVREGTSADTQWVMTNDTATLAVTTLNFTSMGAGVASASETVEGKAELATQAETDTGTDDLRIVTPLKLKNTSNTFRPRKNETAVGDGSALNYVITHNFNTRAVEVDVYRNSTPWDTVGCDVERTSVNSVTVRFAVAPTASQFNVVIIG